MGEEEEKAGAPVPPEGCRPMFIQMSSLEKYEMKTGPDVVDCVPYKLFNTEVIKKEIMEIGFMSDFHSHHKEIETYSGEELLVVFDPEETYGDSFLLCVTEEAKDRELGKLKAKEEAAEAERLQREEEERAAKAAEEARKNAVYEDKPFVARPYVSETGDATEEEISKLATHPQRPLLCCTLSRPRSTFGHRYVFGERDADNDKYVEFRSHKNPDFVDSAVRVREVGLQGAPSYAAHSTQTTWWRPVNKAVQYTPVSSSGSQTGAVPGNGGQSGDVRMSQNIQDRLAIFLDKVTATMEDALQQNETVEIFEDAFAHVGDEEGAVSNKGDNDLKELRTFNDIMFSKNMSLSAVQWHPRRRGMLAVSPIRNLSFDERVEVSGRAHTSHVLLWDFVDLIHPQVMLESPHEIFCFRFNRNPGQHNLVVGGCMNGQVVMWDLHEAMRKLDSQQNKNSSSRRLRDDESTEGDVIPPVTPLAVSQIDLSHRRMVADLAWLSPNTQINFKGQLVDKEHLDGHSYQFVTVSGDGQCLFWDTRYLDIAEGKLPWIAKPRTAPQNDRHKDKEPPKWFPLFCMQVKRLEGVGELSICRLSLLDGLEFGDGVDRRSHLFASTEEGELLYADWRAKPAGKEDGQDDDGEGADTPEYVQWMAPDHTRPSVALQPSPFFPNLMLSVGDWSFQLWMLGREVPIFSSPSASTYLTTGRWSPTRPGMLFIAKQDGSMDIWDLTDSSYKPSITCTVASTSITSMEFLTGANSSAKNQLFAAGDMVGNLHVFDVPRSLWRPSVGEKQLMSTFIDREVERVDYVRERTLIRQAEAGTGEQEDDFGRDDEPAEDQAALAFEKAPEDEVDAPLTAEELKEEEGKYTELEKKFIEELGLTAEDLPESWLKMNRIEGGDSGPISVQ